MSNVIGEGVIKVTADASGVRAGINDAKGALQGLREAAKSAGETLDKQSTTYLRSLEKQSASLERQASTFGKSKAEIAAYNAAQLGVSQTSAAFVTRIDAAEKSLRAQALAAKQAADAAIALAASQRTYTASAAQTAAALRGVPAQFTDIVTSLQGGQAPLTVLLQQGGQLKDMFGGLGPAVRAVGGYVAGLVNPFTIAAAAAAALTAIFYEGNKESGEYRKALILTGNYAGQTFGQLSDMARAISQNIGTQGKAAEVLATLAGSGKIAGTSLKSVATAAIELERTTGQSIDKTVQQFMALADEPTKASAKLNESLHYLSVATFERIASLEEQGRKEEAAALAQQSLAKAVDDRSRSIKQSLGTLESAWQSVGDYARKAWDKMLNIGRPETATDAVAKAQKNLDDLLARGQGITGRGGQRKASDADVQAARTALDLAQANVREQAKLADFDAGRASVQQAGIAAAKKLKESQDADLPRAQKLNKELADRKVLYDQLRASNPTSDLLRNEAQDYANIREKYKPAKTPEFRDDAATKMLETLREQEASLRAQLDTAGKLTDAEKDRAKFLQLLSDLKDKKVLTSDQKSLVAAQAAIKAQLDQNVAVSIGVEAEKNKAAEALKYQKAVADTQAYIAGLNRSIASAQEGRSEQYDRSLNVFGKGSQALEQLNSTKAIYKEFQNYQRALTEKASADKTLGSDDYKAEVVRIRTSLEEALTINGKYYEDLQAKQGDWTNGASQAYANYLDNVRNVSKQTEDLFARAFDGAADAITQFVTTGKGNFGSLVQSILAGLVKIQVQSALTGNGAAGGGLFGWLSGLITGRSGGGGTPGAPLSRLGEAGIDGYLAAGGPARAGGTYLVGEKGPELLRMGSRSGSVTPNDKIPTGGSTTLIQNFTVGDVASMAQVRAEVSQAQRQGQSALARSRDYGGISA